MPAEEATEYQLGLAATEESASLEQHELDASACLRQERVRIPGLERSYYASHRAVVDYGLVGLRLRWKRGGKDRQDRCNCDNWPHSYTAKQKHHRRSVIVTH
jgi:hypothetical protein